MFDFLAGLLAFFYELWPSYGGAILLFTLAVMLVLSPLSIKSTRSMLAMQRLGPDMKKLQQKHKGDREALNREMMAFYQENNVNPFSSCLPLLLQMPVFIVLYQVLNGLTRRSVSGDSLSNFNPKYLEGENTPLAVALRGANEMRSFGMDLSQSALSELQKDGLLVAVPFIILVALVVLTAFVQQRQISGRNPSASLQQQRIGKILPLIFIPFSVSLPAGVVVYFVVSNAVRVGQQAVVSRLERTTTSPGPPREIEGKVTKAQVKKGPKTAKEVTKGPKTAKGVTKGPKAAKARRPGPRRQAGTGSNGKGPLSATAGGGSNGKDVKGPDGVTGSTTPKRAAPRGPGPSRPRSRKKKKRR